MVITSSAPAGTVVATPSGSQTQTILQQQPQPVSFNPSRISATLRLRGGPSHDRRVTWDSAVIDNEGMGKKKSKVCCIFHPNRPFGESSDESSSDSSSDSDSDSGDDGSARPTSGSKRKCDHNHGKGSNRKHRTPKPNAYERVPKPPLKKAQTTST